MPIFAAALVEIVLNQRRNLLAALAQRWDFETDHIQAIEQVFAELALCDQLLEIGVGRRDDAHIDR